MKQSADMNSQTHNQMIVQRKLDASGLAHFAAYHEMSDVPVTFKSLEEEFLSRLALVEDLQKRFHFMMTELKSAGLKTEE